MKVSRFNNMLVGLAELGDFVSELAILVATFGSVIGLGFWQLKTVCQTNSGKPTVAVVICDSTLRDRSDERRARNSQVRPRQVSCLDARLEDRLHDIGCIVKWHLSSHQILYFGRNTHDDFFLVIHPSSPAWGRPLVSNSRS